MAAPSSSKPGALHYWFAFFVTLTLLFLVTTIIYVKEFNAADIRAKEASDNATKVNGALTTALADIDALKLDMGYNQPEVGVGNPAPANSARAQLQQDLTTYGRNLTAGTVSATLNALRTALDQAEADSKKNKADLDQVSAKLLAVDAGAENRVATFKTDKEKSETDLTKLVKDRDELVRQKDQEIQKWQKNYREGQVELEGARDELARVRKELDERISSLNQIVDFQRQKLDELQNLSFDKADGSIRNVDNSLRLVWLDIGRKDGLRPQVTFSVYGKTNNGIARGPQDVKAKIEVVTVEQTSSIARIVEEDNTRPIAEGDVLFSPAWTAGLEEYFSFVGNGDLNKDGLMDARDRKILFDVLANAGAKVDIQVDDEGVREPADAKLTVNTKWLIVGDVGDPTKFEGDDEKIQKILAVQKQHQILVQEAREQGIKIVSLRDFLTYMGWKPESQLYIPGSDAPFILKAGLKK